MKSTRYLLLLMLFALQSLEVCFGQITGNTIQYTYGTLGICGGTSFTAGDAIHGSVAPILKGGNGTYTYQWNFSINSGNSYSTITGATKADYFPGTINQTTVFTRTALSAGLTSTSNQLYFEIDPSKITGNTIYINSDHTAEHDIACGTPSYSPGLLSDPASPGLGGGNKTNYQFQWFSSTDNGTSYTIAKDGTGKTIQSETFTPTAISKTTWYVRTVTSGACIDQSAPIKFIFGALTGNFIKSPPITSACGTSIYTPQTIKGSVLPSGYTYQWQSGPDSLTYTNIAGATSQDLNPTPISTTTAYRRIGTSSGGCISYTNSVVISVAPAFSSNSIGSTQTVNSGVAPSQLTGAAVSAGSNSISYNWQSSTDSLGTYSSAPGVNVMQDYQPGAVIATAFFRRLASSGACNSTSNVVGVHLNGAPPICTSSNVISATQTLDSASTPAPFTGNIVTATKGTITYTWQSSTDNKTFVPAPGVNNLQNYQAPKALAIAYYNRVASTGSCNSVSNTLAILLKGHKPPNNCIGSPTSSDMGISLIHKPGSKGTGTTYDYTLTASNFGPDDATNIIVRDTLPSNVTYQGSTADKGKGTYDFTTRILTWNVGPLRSKATVGLILTVSPQSNDQIITKLGITADQCDPDLTNNARRDTINDPLPIFLASYIPDIITPNGDGKNDHWVIKSITTKAFINNSVVIFDRWGNTVFSATGYQNNWDGTGLSAGTYFYVLKVNDSQKTLNFKGYITLMR